MWGTSRGHHASLLDMGSRLWFSQRSIKRNIAAPANNFNAVAEQRPTLFATSSLCWSLFNSILDASGQPATRHVLSTRYYVKLQKVATPHQSSEYIPTTTPASTPFTSHWLQDPESYLDQSTHQPIIGILH